MINDEEFASLLNDAINKLGMKDIDVARLIDRLQKKITESK